MSAVVVLDAGPAGLLTNPHANPVPVAIRQWLAALVVAGRRVVLPEIVDYELRREFVRAGLTRSLVLLDSLPNQIDYLPLTTPAMRLAADLWAQVHNTGLQTAPDQALDGDVILAAQALSLNTAVVVATANPAHLSRFVAASDWTAITP